MAQQPNNRKPFAPADRRAELVRRGVTQQAVAKACRADYSLVSRVLSGERLTSKTANRIMAYIAGVIGQPLEVVFPEADRRTGTDRRTANAA